MKETSEAVLRQIDARYVHPLQPPRYRAGTINTTRYTIRARPMTHISFPCNLIYSVLRIARPDNIARERKSHLNMHSAARRARELISRHGRHLAEEYFSVLPPCVSLKNPLTYPHQLIYPLSYPYMLMCRLIFCTALSRRPS